MMSATAGPAAAHNVKKWGSPLEYRLRHDVTIYHGKVEGGTGTQSLVPPDIPKETWTSCCS